MNWQYGQNKSGVLDDAHGSGIIPNPQSWMLSITIKSEVFPFTMIKYYSSFLF